VRAVAAIGGAIIVLFLIALALGQPADRDLLESLLAVAVSLGVLVLLMAHAEALCAAEDRMWSALFRRLRRFAKGFAKPS
jgi:hypothetical protein